MLVHEQVEHLKGIVYEQDALLYSFHEVTSSRDIHRPHKNNIGPVNSFEINRRYVVCYLHRCYLSALTLGSPADHTATTAIWTCKAAYG